MDFQNKNQYQYPNFNPNEQLNFDQLGNNENICSQSKEEEIRSEINTTIRLGFVRKVYGILSIQLFITTLFSGFAMISKSLKEFMVYHTGILFLMLILIIVLPMVIVCCVGIMRQVPQNYIILFIFTFAESYCVAFICAYSKPEIVFMAATMTFVMVFSLTLYAINTKTDITMKGGLFFILSAALLLFIIFGWIVRNRLFHVIIALISVVLFSLYIIYDTQVIMGDKQEMLQLDDYILGAFMIYTDIITIFLQLLKIINYFYDN